MTALSRLALVDQIRRLPWPEAEALLATLDPLELAALAPLWREFWARPDQIAPPGRWKHWMLCGGRGTGKTTTLAQWIIERARGGFGPIRLIAGTLADVRATIVEGDSGILAWSPADFMPTWEPSVDDGAGLLTWPNGVTARGFSAEKPRRLRGKQSRTDAYDDLAGMGPKAKEVFDMAQFGLRIWGDCRAVYTTTPEDTPIIVHLLESEGFKPGTIVRTRSETDDNIGNLTPDFISSLEQQYAGTELMDQERKGILIKRSKSSPFHGIEFAAHRVDRIDPRQLEEVAIAHDPAEGAGEEHDEHGIVVSGRIIGSRRVATMEDLSGVYDDAEAGAAIIAAVERWSAAAPQARIVIVAETNRGEERVRTLINAAYYKRRAEAAEHGSPPPPPLPEIVGVKAKEGKILRAGPLRPLLVTGMLVHLPDLGKLEAQAHGLRPGAPKRKRSDDRIDAEVHAVTYLVSPGAVADAHEDVKDDAWGDESRYAGGMVEDRGYG